MFLYYITDRTQLSAESNTAARLLLERIAAAARAGIDAIQIREKDLSTRDLAALAARAVEIVQEANSRSPTKIQSKVLINSRIDVALASRADGVHLRSDDISPADARSVFMQAGLARILVGMSCHTLREIELAEGQGADFAVFGPVFEKSGHLASGQEALYRACNRRAAKPAMPVLALGGVTLANAGKCLEAGAAGIAGIRLFQSGNVAETVSRLRELVA